MKHHVPTLLRGLIAAAALAGAHADVTPRAVTLTGTTSYDEWTTSSLTGTANPGYGSFPGTAAWPAPIGSNLGGDAGLMKLSNGYGGGPYPAGGSIYYGGYSGAVNNPNGVLAVSDSTLEFGINTVVFQITIGEAWTYDFYNHEMPTLSYNGGSQNLAPTFASLVAQDYNGTVDMPTGQEDLYNNLYALQWDLSGIGEDIASYSISWTGVQHAQLYALRLDASSAVYDSAVLAAVPEPATWLLAGAALGALLVFRRRIGRNKS